MYSGKRVRAPYLGLQLLLFVTILCMVRAGKVLFIITPGPQSHMFGMRKIASELVSRQHNVLLLAADGEAAKLRSTGIPILQYSLPAIPGGLNLSNLNIQGSQSFMSAVVMANKLFAGSCDTLVSNSSIKAQLREFEADIMVGTTFSLCTQVLASKLDTHFLNYFPAGPFDPFFTSLYPGSNRRAFLPNPLSYNPQAGVTAASQHMTFTERLKNVATFLRMSLFDVFNLRPSVIEFYKRHGVDLAAPQEIRRLLMHLISADFAMEWVRPLPPNVKFVGPVLPEPPKPLPVELEAFVDGAGEAGVLYVAMGTVATLGLKERKAMAAVFAALPVKVLWRLSTLEVPDEAALAELGIGSNTKVITWAPQNDLLGHPAVKVFLSHCGGNSMYEAAYHGVPVVGLPFFADQPANAGKIVAKGMGARILHEDLFTPAFGEVITKVLSDPSYRAAAELISRKLRARKRTPVQEAADWVEHALETKGEPYLRTPEEELSFIERHNLDVYACIAAAASGLLFSLWKISQAAGCMLLSTGEKVKSL